MKKRRLLISLVTAGALLLSSTLTAFAADSYAKIGNTPKVTHKYSSKDYIIIDGLDISRYQGNISLSQWKQLKKAGIDFVFLRSNIAFYSTSHKVYPTQIKKESSDDSRLGEDALFQTNYKNAKNANLMIGTYTFTTAVTKEEAVHEAKHTLATLNKRALDLPVMFDSECTSYRCSGLTGAKRVTLASAFYDYIEKHSDYKAGYYSSKSLLSQSSFQTNLPKIEKRGPLWLAQYYNKVTYRGDFEFWQYTSSGTFSFLSGKRFDCNYWYFDRNSQIKGPDSSICEVSSNSSAVKYTGEPVEPEVTVTCNGETLTKGTDYKVNYVKNVKEGTGYAIVSGLGKYKGQAAAPFTITTKEIVEEEAPPLKAPTKLVLKQAKSGKYRTVTASWSKVEGADGYKVYYKKSTSSKYTFLTKLKNKRSAKKTKLSANKKYYFKVIPYRTEDGSDKSGKAIIKSIRTK